MQDDYFPSFFYIRLINETPFIELYGFHIRMVGEDSRQSDTGILRTETDVDRTLPDGCSCRNDIVGKMGIGNQEIFVVQLNLPPLF